MCASAGANVSEVETLALELGLRAPTIVRLAGATGNLCYRVRSGDSDCVFRQARRDARPTRLALVRGVHELLLREKLPVPELMYASNAASPWTITRFISGSPFDYRSARQLASAARVLARVHAVDVRALRASWVAPDDSPSSWMDDVDSALAAAQAAVEPELREATAWSVFADAAHDVVAALAPQELSTLPRTLTHGDFHGSNLLFAGDVVVGLLDLDAVDVAPRAADVAYAVLMMARKGRGRFDLRKSAFEIFLQGYDQGPRPLEPSERRLLAPLMLLSQLPEAGYLVTAHGVADRRRNLGSCLTAIEAIRSQWNCIETWARGA
jgi:aminoglycoside phosphotransferase (APT) family kinase protein